MYMGCRTEEQHRELGSSPVSEEGQAIKWSVASGGGVEAVGQMQRQHEVSIRAETMWLSTDKS
jgi:hypothetical protein